MKCVSASALFLAACLYCLAAWAAAPADSVPADCTQYTSSPRRETCENARRHGLSLNAAALVEGLAERAYAVEFCGGTPDPAEQRHTESILAGSPAFRALYDEHLTLLHQRCIYDPGGWCRDRGLTRR